MVGERGKAARALLLGVVLLSVTAVAALDVSARSGGMDRGEGEVNFAEVGCQCHNADPDSGVVPILEGLPWQFTAGAEYLLNVTMIGGPPENPDGNKGGFNLLVTGGQLAAAEGYEEWLQNANPLEATHTAAGARETRFWQLVWTAPAAGDENVAVVLTVNAVDGTGVQDPADRWNRASFIVRGPEGSLPEASLGAAAVPIHKIGVHYLAYWVGVIAFAVLFVSYGASFFLFKYGETKATTDHRDRPGAGVSGPQAFLDRFGFWIAMLLAMILVIVAIVRAL